MYFGAKLIRSNNVTVVTDRFGSVRGTSNSEVMRYTPYGTERTRTSDGREKWGTYFRDMGTGNDYADQRYKGVGMGAFLSPDPGGIATANPSNPITWNRYLYANADPANFNDPNGLYAEGTPPVDLTQLCQSMLGTQSYQWQFTNPDAAGYASAQMACQNSVNTFFQVPGAAGVAAGGVAGGTAHSPGSQFGPPGYSQALNALQHANPQCLHDINAANDNVAANALINSTIVYQYGTVPTVNNNGNITNGATPASEVNNTITLNLNFGFMSPSNLTANTVAGGTTQINFLQGVANNLLLQNLSVTQYQELLLIHEIGHLLGIPQEQNWNYNRSIFRDCIQ